MRLFKILFIVVFFASIQSCKKKKDAPTPLPVDTFSNGILVVNEGLFQQNNSTLTWVDFEKNEVNNEIFEQKTGRQLGDTGNDIVRYGSKVYIVVTTSNTLEIIDAKNGNNIKQLQMVANGVPKQPRNMAVADGKVFITCFDGYVDVLDTTNLEITQRIKVGSNPDGIQVSTNQLFVCNSGGLSYPNVDSTVSIINLSSLVETSKLVVGKNPTQMTKDAFGNLYVVALTPALSFDDYQLIKINTQTAQIDSVFSWDVQKVTPIGNHLMLYVASNNVSSIQLFDPLTNNIVNSNFIPTNLFTTYYGAKYDSYRQQIYCFDVMSYTNRGYIRVFTQSGTHLKNIQVGLNPSKLIIYE